MSVSSRALFNVDVPPRILSPPPHRIGDDLIELVGGVPHRTEDRIGFRPPGCWRAALPQERLLLQTLGMLGHLVEFIGIIPHLPRRPLARPGYRPRRHLTPQLEVKPPLLIR